MSITAVQPRTTVLRSIKAKKNTQPEIFPHQYRTTISFEDRESIENAIHVNRIAIDPNVEKLCESVKRKGILRDILVSQVSLKGGPIKTYILDGNHLYVALIKLGMDIPIRYVCVKDEKEFIDTMSFFNSSSKSWIIENYVKAYGTINSDYKLLGIFKKEYQYLGYPIIINTLIHGNPKGKSYNVKKGTFEIGNKSQAKVRLKYVDDYFGIIGVNSHIGTKKYHLGEFLKYLDLKGVEYQHEIFMKYVANNVNKIICTVTPKAGDLVKLFMKCK